MRELFSSHARVTNRLLISGLILCGLATNVWIFSTGWIGLSLSSRAARLQQLASDPSNLKLQTVAAEIHGARFELAFLRGGLAPLLWLSSQMGGDVGALQPLMDAAVESTIAVDDSLSALGPSLNDLTLGSLSMSAVPRLLESLATARPALMRSETHLNLAAAALARAHGPFSPRVERALSQAQKMIELGRIGLGAAQVAPELLGNGGSRTYLVLVQNSDELRATGGFITNLGRIEISHGNVISQTFQGSYAVDDFTRSYPDPPKPLLEYMGSEQWVLRDGNWSPDFPTAARDVIRLYRVSRPEAVDGVIALNQKAVLMILAGLEPLDVEGMSDPLTTANAEQLFQDAWKAGLIEATRTADLSVWYDTRKRFVGTMVLAATDRLKTGKVNWTSLVQGTLDAIRQRQVMIYTAGPEAAELKQLEWDGGLRSSDGDYLMIVDSNIGYSKGNPLLDQRASYKVKLDTAGKGHATLVLDYTHRGTKSNIVCSGVPIPYVETLTYEDMMHRCYYDYIRLIVPPGSELQGSIAHPVPGKYLLSRKPADGVAETLPGENGRTVFGQFFVVDYGKRLQAQFEYDLPTLVRDNGAFKQYSLLLQKQSGTDAMPVKVTLYLPPKAQLILAKPQPVSLPGDPLEFNLVLDTDRKVQVVYALAP